ncbi:hypothetical protein CARUB_v10003867mg [Capsella rubella]|uniref:J domain-containing protein n=1 Tax=Capsella rubella TaxID=81985 RepID=R0HDH4_9BRAS|nr:hypothetical protein CARUB_v10003867mg [Capsella rubella]
MECNKDEARRAMDIAERKVSENDYFGAKKFVNKAQVLYPDLVEADWYRVLGVEPLADDDALKRQYKKLALLLHPDKNRFKGAEGAFKLVSQAWCLLSDKVKRSAYDQKRKLKKAKKPPNPPHNVNQDARGGVDTSARATSDKPKPPKPPKPHKPASSYEHQNVRDYVYPSPKARSYKHAPARTDSFEQVKDNMWFWAKCNRCKTQCQYLAPYCHYKTIHCQNCGQDFIATQTMKPVNYSSSPQQQQQQNRATNKSTNGASSSSSAAQETPQASAKSSATNEETIGAQKWNAQNTYVT